MLKEEELEKMKDERERLVNGRNIFVHQMKNFKTRDCLKGQPASLAGDVPDHACWQLGPGSAEL